jgi:hypothetical protein
MAEPRSSGYLTPFGNAHAVDAYLRGYSRELIWPMPRHLICVSSILIDPLIYISTFPTRRRAQEYSALTTLGTSFRE